MYFKINGFIYSLFIAILLVDYCVGNMSKTFMYFAYGSNLLAKRIHINSPSAVRKGHGKLKDYRLDFNIYSKVWKGAAATIVPCKNCTVWGAIWEIDSSTLSNLDRQEGVHNNLYFPFETNIELPDGTEILCRTYQQCQTPSELKDGETIPADRKPSAAYLNTIIKGAEESNLPEDYQEKLKKIEHNGYDGDVNLQIN